METYKTITEISSNKRLVLEGCEGIIDFTDELISLKSGRLKISVNGKELKIKIFSSTTAVIEGFIKNVNFDYF